MKEFVCIVLQLLFVAHVKCWNEGSVLLRDVQALTLYKGSYTSARRSSPVPQLQCIGGSAGCFAFVPEVVQCQNRGWDGVDVQWECKTDMDNAYRFGKVEVSCEGFSQPDDPYILRGSCGLEYTLELTGEGRRKHGASHGGSRGFGDYASSFFNGFSSNNHGNSQQQQKSASSLGEESGSIFGVVVLLLLAFGVYKLFLSGTTNTHAPDQQGYHGDGTQPPPPGFRPDYTGSSSSGCPGSGYPGYNGGSPGYGFRSDYNGQQYAGRRAGAGTGTGSGFWTGMGTGGLLGYMFGNQRRQSNNYFNSNTSYSAPRTPPSPNPTASTGTRTASGFGGTKRR
ncbi:store-operated calcium entry-associated regulatory factor [Osmerus mordax]|uniref:store-operated calcium entry-associated regulatory factor n=1 Tax=Osmerus mordax TaxID=8014 RepID=UPI00350F69D9